MHIQSQRGREVMHTIRTALMQHWDPIGVAHIPEAADEYDSYVGSVYRILASTRSEEELVEFLHRTETETMGLNPRSGDTMRAVARHLLSLDVRV